MNRIVSIAVLAVAVLSGCGSSDGPEEMEQMSDAEALTRIESPDSAEYERTLRRFDFLLNQFVRNCSDVGGSRSGFASMLAALHRSFRESGLDEGLLEMANALHRMSAEIASDLNFDGLGPPKCAETWSAYIVLREQGVSSDEAIEGVAEIHD